MSDDICCRDITECMEWNHKQPLSHRLSKLLKKTLYILIQHRKVISPAETGRGVDLYIGENNMFRCAAGGGFMCAEAICASLLSPPEEGRVLFKNF